MSLYWGKVPQLILWKPLCLCPCAKQLQLLPLARILAKYWWLPVETRPVKTIWEETSFSGDDSRAKQNHRQCGGIRTQPNLPTSREWREHQKEEGNRQIVSKKRRSQKGQGEDKEDVDTEICKTWLGLSTLQYHVILHYSHLVCSYLLVYPYCTQVHSLTLLLHSQVKSSQVYLNSTYLQVGLQQAQCASRQKQKQAKLIHDKIREDKMALHITYKMRQRQKHIRLYILNITQKHHIIVAHA